LLQPAERWIKGTILYLKEIIRGPLDVLANLMPVRTAIKERPEDEHIERSLENRHTLLCLLVGGRHSTLNRKGW
jgi:hypothetical protein